MSITEVLVMANKLPYLKLYIGDLKKEHSYICLSIEARLVWLEMLFIMHDAVPRGYLDMSADQIARAISVPEKIVKRGLAEMERVGTFSRTDEGVIFNRRMVREDSLHEVRAAAGAAGGFATAKRQQNRKSTTAKQQQNRDADADSDNKEKEKDTNDAETLRGWLEQFTEGKLGPADDSIVLKMLEIIGDFPIECFQDFLIDLHNRKHKPDNSYGWFIGIAGEYFRGLKRGRKQLSKSQS